MFSKDSVLIMSFSERSANNKSDIPIFLKLFLIAMT